MREDYREGQLVIYTNGDRVEVGKIKSLKESGAFIWFHEGATAALTPYSSIKPVTNSHCIKQTSLGGIEEC